MTKLKNSDIQNQISASGAGVSKNTSRRIMQGMIFTIGLVTFLFIIGHKLSDPMTLPVRHVSINGDFYHLSPKSLQERASKVVRGGFFNVNVDAIQEVVSEEPWVKEIMVSRIWPDRIMVDIKEQEAIAKWKNNALINEDAFIFYPDISTIPEQLPYLSGPENSANLILEYLHKFTEIIPNTVKVKELHLSDRRSWELILDNNLVLHLGKTDVLEKTRQFFKYYSSISVTDGRQINYVDLRYTNGFVIGWQTKNESQLINGLEKNG